MPLLLPLLEAPREVLETGTGLVGFGLVIDLLVSKTNDSLSRILAVGSGDKLTMEARTGVEVEDVEVGVEIPPSVTAIASSVEPSVGSIEAAEGIIRLLEVCTATGSKDGIGTGAMVGLVGAAMLGIVGLAMLGIETGTMDGISGVSAVARALALAAIAAPPAMISMILETKLSAVMIFTLLASSLDTEPAI